MTNQEQQRLLAVVVESDETVARDEGSTNPDARQRVVDAWVQKADALCELERSEEALVATDTALALLEAGTEPRLGPEHVASMMRVRALSLWRIGRMEDSARAADELLVRFSGLQPAPVRFCVARAGLIKSSALSKTGHYVDAEEAADWLVKGFAIDPLQGPENVDIVATALLRKALALRHQELLDAAVKVLDAVALRLEVSSAGNAHRVLAEALNTKAGILGKTGRSEEALELREGIVARFGETDEQRVQGQVLVALMGQGLSLQRSGKLAEAVLLYDDAAERAERYLSRGGAAQVMYVKAAYLKELGRFEDAIEACDAVLERLKENDQRLAAMRRVADTMWVKGRCLSGLGRLDKEHEVLRALVAACRDISDRDVQRVTAFAMYNDAVLLRDRGSIAEAIGLFDAIENRYGQDAPTGAPFIVIDAQIGKLQLLVSQGLRLEKAVADLDLLVARCDAIDHPGRQTRLAALLALRRDCLGVAGRAEEVLVADDDIIDRFGDRSDAELVGRVSYAMQNKVEWMLRIRRIDDAIAASEQLLERFEQAPEPDVAEQLLRSASLLVTHPGLDDHQTTAVQIILASTRAIEQAVAALLPRQLRRAIPSTLVTEALARQQRRYQQALKITKRLADEYEDSPETEIAQNARLKMVPALWAVGRPLGAIKTTQRIISVAQASAAASSQAGEQSGSRPALSTTSPPLAYLQAIAIARLKDGARTAAAYDTFIENFDGRSSPFDKWLVQNARAESRKSPNHDAETHRGLDRVTGLPLERTPDRASAGSRSPRKAVKGQPAPLDDPNGPPSRSRRRR